MKIDSQKQYIHIERDNKEERIIIDAKNVSSEDTIYLLTEFIDFVSKKEDMPAKIFLTMIGLAIIKKEELENKRGNKE